MFDLQQIIVIDAYFEIKFVNLYFFPTTIAIRKSCYCKWFSHYIQDVLQTYDNCHLLYIQDEHNIDIENTQQLHEHSLYNKHVVFNFKLWYIKHVYFFPLINMMLLYVRCNHPCSSQQHTKNITETCFAKFVMKQKFHLTLCARI